MAQKRPVIGVTVDSTDDFQAYFSKPSYAAAVEKAGGLPILLPYKVDRALIAQYLDLMQGVVLSGGADLDPALYGSEAWHPHAVKVDPDRQNFELALLREIEARRMPVLGVCLGSQVMNVHRGGTLTQFLPDVAQQNAIEHRRFPKQPLTRHPVTVDTHSQLGAALGSADVSVNTYHKQGVKTLGRGLKIVATAPDGLIEAFEDPSFPLLAAVQWHPERLIDEPSHLAPFELLVRKAAEAGH